MQGRPGRVETKFDAAPFWASLAWAAWHGIKGGREGRPVQKHGVGCVFSPSALEPNDPASVAPSEEVGQTQARAERPWTTQQLDSSPGLQVDS